MATGFPTAYLMEVEFTAGVWTDITADVDFGVEVRVTYGRAREGEPVAPGSMELTLYNSTGKFVPDNPGSPYYPNVVERKRIRYTVTKGVARTRFLGYIVAWQPWIPAGESATAGMCSVSATTYDGIASRPIYSPWDEEAVLATATTGACWPLSLQDGSTDPSALIRRGGSVAASRMLTQLTGAGTIVAGSADGDVQITGALSFQPEAGKGAALEFTATLGSLNWGFDFWFRTSEVVTATQHVATFKRKSGSSVLLAATVRLEASGGATDLVFLDSAATEVGRMRGVNDGVWRLISVYRSELLSVGWQSNDARGGSSIGGGGSDPSTFFSATFGSPDLIDGPILTTTCPFEIGSVAVAAVQGPAVGAYAVAGPRFLTAKQSAASWLDYVKDWYGFTYTTSGTAGGGTVVPMLTAGAPLATILQRTAAAVGGIAWVTPAGSIELRYADAVRTATPVLTLSLEADDDGTLEVARQVDALPTRGRVTFALGESVAIKTAAETGGVSREASIEADAPNGVIAEGIAQSLIADNGALQVTKIGFSLVSAVNDLYAQHAALYPAARARITNLPSGFFGYTQTDVLVQGWTETYSVNDVRVELDCTPADAPYQGLIGDRIGTSGSTLNGALTNSATSVPLTSAVGETWTTSAADYPLTIRIDGEQITCPNAPASATNPAFTGCTRGVNGTIAAAHSTGAAVYVMNTLVIGMG